MNKKHQTTAREIQTFIKKQKIYIHIHARINQKWLTTKTLNSFNNLQQEEEEEGETTNPRAPNRIVKKNQKIEHE